MMGPRMIMSATYRVDKFLVIDFKSIMYIMGVSILRPAVSTASNLVSLPVDEVLRQRDSVVCVLSHTREEYVNIFVKLSFISESVSVGPKNLR